MSVAQLLEICDIFSGEKGRELFSHKSVLESLSLASNDLEVLQTKLLSNLSLLEHLDLGFNRIHDIMSGQFQQLSVLRSLNLSFNSLNGFNHSIAEPLVRYVLLKYQGHLCSTCHLCVKSLVRHISCDLMVKLVDKVYAICVSETSVGYVQLVHTKSMFKVLTRVVYSLNRQLCECDKILIFCK